MNNIKNAESNYSGYIAINYITCNPDYVNRFEELFGSRVHAIDTMPGFLSMEVLKSDSRDNQYLIISRWESEAQFKAWTGSKAFLEGHKRAFEDIREAKEKGKTLPMQSDFKTYQILCR